MSETILVVEDNDLVRHLVRTFVELAGYNAVEASTPEEAIAAARDHGSIDILLTDVHLTSISGVDVGRVLTQLFPSVRVLYMSGHGDVSWAGPFIGKPFTSGELAAALEALPPASAA
jgi:DNA-binding NtrC family response regulator